MLITGKKPPFKPYKGIIERGEKAITEHKEFEFSISRNWFEGLFLEIVSHCLSLLAGLRAACRPNETVTAKD